MANFNIQGHSKDKFISSVSKAQRNIHPYTGEPLQYKTTASQEPPRESLTAFTTSEILQGVATQRPDAQTWDAFNQSMSGDLGHFIRSEGGIEGVMGGRAPLLADDIMSKYAGTDDIFTAERGISGVVSSGIAEVTSQGAAPTVAEAVAQIGETPAATAGRLQRPTDGPQTSPFGMRWGKLHAGLDFGVPVGSPIIAAESGVITMASWVAGYGNFMSIDHGGGLHTNYAHLSSYQSAVGDHVKRGQLIGLSGNTGNSTGPHLHFEVRRGTNWSGQAEDPAPWL